MSLGFGLVGCGRIAMKHAGILADGHVRGGSLVAVCDVKEGRAKALGEKHGVPFYGNMHEMMNSHEDIDVVNVLTPSGMHARNTVELAPYGKHIVVEKPMALTIDDADRMIKVCDAAGIRLFVVKQNRYNPPIIKLREAIDSGRFGKLVLGTVRVRWCRPQDYYDQDAWRGTWAQDGGVFTNQASHHIDLLEWMMGDPESVFAKSQTSLVDIEAEDTGAAILKFTNGALGVVEATTATRPKDIEGSVSILGENGSVVVGGFAANRIDVWEFSDKQPGDDTIREECNQTPPNVYGFGHVPYLEHVINSIENDTPALVDGLEGRRSLELIMAIYESVETGEEVSLRFRPKQCRLGLEV